MCKTCAEPSPMLIPQFDPETNLLQSLRVETVSRKCAKALSVIYERPLVYVTPNSWLFSKLSFFHQFLGLKRRLYIIFNTVCRPDLLVTVLDKKFCHLLLKEHILSLSDLHSLSRLEDSRLQLFERKAYHISDLTFQTMVDRLANLEKRIDVLFESLKNRKSLENLVQKFEKWGKFKSAG